VGSLASLNHSAASRRRALTLTETLALIPVIVVALAMSFPSLRQARARSRNDVCLDRLHAIAAAARQYASRDAADMMIPIPPIMGGEPGRLFNGFLGGFVWGGKSGVGLPDWVQFPGDLGSKYGTASGVGPATRPLNAILYPNGLKDAWSREQFNRDWATRDTILPLDSYRCPADDGPPGGAHCNDWVEHPGKSSFDYFGNSYAANNMVSSVDSSQHTEIRSISPLFRAVSRVPNPARTVAFEENIGHFAWAAKWEIEGCEWIGEGLDPGPTKAIRGWHGKNWTFNTAFIDGHGGVVQTYIEGTERSDGYAEHYRREQVFDDPLYQQAYKCVIIRGPGWQKDTFPAPDIGTGILRWYFSGRTSFLGCTG